MKTNPLPSWGKHFFAARKVAVIEEVMIDRDRSELVWYTRNIGLQSFMATVERATLWNKSNEETGVRKQCWIDSSIVGFRSAIKSFGVERYKSNCGPATQGFLYVLEEKLRKEKDTSHKSLKSSQVCNYKNEKEGLNIFQNVKHWQ